MRILPFSTGRRHEKAQPLVLVWVSLLMLVFSAPIAAGAQAPEAASSETLRAQKKEYLECPDEYCRAEKLAVFESSILTHIAQHGAEGRLVIETIRWTQGYDWIVRFTIKDVSGATGTGGIGSMYRLSLQSSRDIAHGSGVGLWSYNSIIRFDGPVRFPIRSRGDIGGGWLNRGTREDVEKYGVTNGALVMAEPVAGSILFEGDTNDVLTFAMIDQIGFTYLHGKGRVHLADGTIVDLPKSATPDSGNNIEKLGLADAQAKHPCSDIAWVQRRLTDLGYDPGLADGVWGPKSKRALEAFQAVQGLEVTGAPDGSTCEKLQ